MSFETKDLKSQIIAVVEVWSYRIKISICEFKNEKVRLLAYQEKRESTSYFVNGECKNLELLGVSIRDAIKKTEKDNHITIENVVINYPFGELFFYENKLTYKRNYERHLITKEELQEILKKTEKIIIEKCFRNIEEKSWYIEADLRLVISSIINMKIDTNPYEKIIWETWKNVSISIVNMFIPIEKNNTIKYIWEIINKNITKIIPTEFSLRNLFREKELVIIYIWAIYTTITIKSGGKTIGISKIPIWINDLTGMIAKYHKATSNEILKNINTGIYIKSEQDFLDIWKQWLIVWIKEILWEKICPNNFYILSDVGTDFIEKSIEIMNFKDFDIKRVKKIYFIPLDSEYIESQIENCDDFEISIEIAAMILELKNLMKKEKSLLVKSLKEAVSELGYID